MGIPLVALMGRQPQINDYATNIAQAQQIQGMKNQNALAPGQLQGQQNELQMQQMQMEAQKRQIETQKALDDAYKNSVIPDENGQPKIDTNKLSEALRMSGHGSAIPGILEGVTKYQTSLVDMKSKMQKFQEDQADLFGHAGYAIQQANYDPRVAHRLLDPLGDSPQIQQMRQMIDSNPQQFKQIVDSAVAASPAQQKMENERKIAEARSEKNPTEASLALAAAGGDKAAQTALDKLQEQKPEKIPTEAALALKAAQGDPVANAALKRLDQSKRESRPVTNIMTGNDAKDIADAIENGDQPPTLQGLYRNAGPVRAELARRGVPLAKMETDWKATQRYITTLNGTQQTRLRQAISTASDSLDKIEGLYAEWQQLGPASGIKILNKGALAASKQLPGRTGAVATALDAQIADLTAELGNVYMGGNSPTDHSLGLAAKNLSSDWNKETFDEALKQARSNIKIRQNSITHAAPAGVGSEYFQGGGGNAPAQTNFSVPTGAPAAPKEDGHKLKANGQVVAVSKGGSWVAP
jgi:hypothetical protein